MKEIINKFAKAHKESALASPVNYEALSDSL